MKSTRSSTAFGAADAETVRPGPLLERALHAFDNRREAGHAMGVALALFTIAIVTFLILSIAVFGLVFVGAGSQALYDSVAAIESAPLLGPVIMVFILGCFAGLVLRVFRARRSPGAGNT